MRPSLHHALTDAVQKLKKNMPHHEAWHEAEVLLAHILMRDRGYLIAHREQKLTSSQEKTFLNLVSRRIKHKPLAYLLGAKDFYGQRFMVNQSVLIPRPETELFIDQAKIVLSKKTHSWTVLDIGTGSGAIAVTLAHLFPDAKIIASDISRRALTVARQNARQHKVRVTFLHANLFDKKLQRALTPTGYLFIANLPYLPMRDKKHLMPDVAKFEPARALFAKKDGRELIERFLTQVAAWRIKGLGITDATILLECDPPQAAKLVTFTRRLFPKANTEIQKDLCGRDRALKIILPPNQQTSDRLS